VLLRRPVLGQLNLRIEHSAIFQFRRKRSTWGIHEVTDRHYSSEYAIIDEVLMVRADLMNGIAFLRLNANIREPLCVLAHLVGDPFNCP